jgi:hypothetical protein
MNKPELKPPTSIASSSFQIFGVTVRCHVLDDGQRIIEEESVAALLEAMSDLTQPDMGDLESFNRWMRGN